MTTLYDLRIAIGRRQGGVYPLRLSLTGRDPYPPRPAREGEGVILRDTTQSLGEANTQVSAALFTAALPPDALDKPEVLGDPAQLGPIAAAWPPNVLADRMGAVRDGLFAGPQAALLAQFRQTIEPGYSRLPWEAPDAFGRISVELEDPALQRLPWELLGWDGTTDLWQRCAVLRRSPLGVSGRTAPFELPLTVAVYKLAEAVSRSPGWADGLFLGPRSGDYARQVQEMGGLKWIETATPPAPAAVHHVVFSSSQGPGRSGGVFLRDRDGNPVEVGGKRTPSGVEQLTSHLRYNYSTIGREHLPPRLLILHDIGTGVAGPLAAQLAYLGLQAGADAVLLVHFHDLQAAAGDFFSYLYRKILHNWPIDQALVAALGFARSGGGGEPVGWALAVRQGGELHLLLTQTVVESATAAKPPTLAITRGEETPKGIPKPASIRTRADRATADLRERIAQAAAAQKETINRQVEQVAGATFTEEIHTLDFMLHAQAEVKQAAAAVQAGREALQKLEGVQPATVQQGTIRVTNVWLKAGAAGQERPVAPDEALVAREPYGLCVQIGQKVAEALVAAAFPEEALRVVFERVDKVTLDVMVFAPAEDFAIPQPRGQLELPRAGASTELRIEVIPQRPGARRLRVGIYYRNTMLQSLQVETTVVERGATPPAAAGYTAKVDYAASTDLALLDELPPPTVNIFTNETPEGDHWLGIFGQGDLSGFRLNSGQMYSLRDLAAISTPLREKLRDLEGQRAYIYEAPPKLDAEGRLDIASARLVNYEKALCGLAALGRELFFSLFVGSDAGVRNVRELSQQLQAPGLVSVARCRAEGVSLPWAAFYSLRPDSDAGLSLCSVFKGQLAANRWLPDMSGLAEQHDLLDQPAACRAQPSCPLNDADTARRTVCPFGFWGFIHQVEQPLQQVKPTPAGQVPAEMKRDSFNQTSWLVHPSADKVRLAVGAYQDARLETDKHRAELSQLGQAHPIEMDFEEDRTVLVRILEKGEQHIYYFYCHGEMVGNIFKLKVGTAQSPGYISADALSEADWRGVVQPLVILNGCETVALLPERIHVFLATLRDIGACGVVGSEIEVYPGLARPFGREIIRRLLDGQSLGEAFLAARWMLLRQYNPLGLAYAYYAPATLHLHDPQPGACAWCKMHPPARAD